MRASIERPARNSPRTPGVARSRRPARIVRAQHPPLPVISQLLDAGYDVDALAHAHSSGVIPGPMRVKAAPPANETPNVPATFRLDVEMVEGEPRVLDTALAARLGFSRERDIRPLVEANREELEAFGILRAVAANSGQRGRPGTAFYLNRQQALLICILSKTPKAREVRAEVIRRFDAYEVPAAPATAQPGMDQLIGVVVALAQTVQGFIQAATKKAPEADPAPCRTMSPFQ